MRKLEENQGKKYPLTQISEKLVTPKTAYMNSTACQHGWETVAFCISKKGLGKDNGWC